MVLFYSFGKVNGPGGAGPCKVFAPCPRAAQFISSRFNPVARISAIHTVMREGVRVEHPLRMIDGGTFKVGVMGQHLHRRARDRPGRQTCVQRQTVAFSLGLGIKPGPVDHF